MWVGADPGGNDGFGVCILRGDGVAETRCVSCADEAVDFVLAKSGESFNGVGVDAPLWWSSGRASSRWADEWLRRTYRLSGGEVQAVNSLRGAALVQGMMFVERLREAAPEVPVTESHPNAVLRALGIDWLTFCLSFDTHPQVATKHERDAVIAAVCAREGFSGRWTLDLSIKRHPREQDPSTYWLAPVHYFWPSFDAAALTVSASPTSNPI